MIDEYDTQPFLNAFGKRIRALRNQYGLTQVELAVRSQSDERQIQRIEAGVISTKISTAYLIARGFGISISELFQFEVEI